jgi:hypothetical protein
MSVETAFLRLCSLSPLSLEEEEKTSACRHHVAKMIHFARFCSSAKLALDLTGSKTFPVHGIMQLLVPYRNFRRLLTNQVSGCSC